MIFFFQKDFILGCRGSENVDIQDFMIGDLLQDCSDSIPIIKITGGLLHSHADCLKETFPFYKWILNVT